MTYNPKILLSEDVLLFNRLHLTSNADAENIGKQVHIDLQECPKHHSDCDLELLNCHLYGAYLWNPDP